MSRISDETLTGHLAELADEWGRVKAGDEPAKDNTIWWLNQTSYAGERFFVALVDDLLAARGLDPRPVPVPTSTDGREHHR